MLDIPGTTGVDDALEAFFHASGFAPDGGHRRRWIRLRTCRLPLYLPNLGRRKQTLRLHDLHHVATGYDTSWTGEAEIGAWEIGAGCGNHYAAWVIDLVSLAYGVLFAPRRVFRAFVRGRRCKSLFRDAARTIERVETVGDLRRQLGLLEAPCRARAGDIASFAGWCAAIGAAGAYVPGLAASAFVLWRTVAS